LQEREETKNPPPTMTEKMPTTKPPTRSSAVGHVSSQGALALIHERSITVLHPAPTTVCTAVPFSVFSLEAGVPAVELRAEPRPFFFVVENSDARQRAFLRGRTSASCTSATSPSEHSSTSACIWSLRTTPARAYPRRLPATSSTARSEPFLRGARPGADPRCDRADPGVSRRAAAPPAPSEQPMRAQPARGWLRRERR
jgi:hypothetical protein